MTHTNLHPPGLAWPRHETLKRATQSLNSLARMLMDEPCLFNGDLAHELHEILGLDPQSLLFLTQR